MAPWPDLRYHRASGARKPRRDRMARQKNRFVDILLGPHPRLLKIEDRRGARLFAALALIDAILTGVALLCINFMYTALQGRSIWGGQDSRIVIASAAIIFLCYGLIRAGRFRIGAFLYISVAALAPLTVPFVPGPTAEIGVIATAVIPIFLAAMIFEMRWTLVSLAAIVGVAAVRLAASPMAASKIATGYAVLASVAVTGALVLIFRAHFARLEGDRYSQIRQKEEALRENEALLRIIMDNMPAGVMIVDAQTHRIDRVNPATAELFGTPREMIQGRLCHKFLCPAEEGSCPITDLGQEVDRSERVLLRSGGTSLPVIKSVKRINIQGREKLLETFIDITERKQAEEENRRLAEMLDYAPTSITIHDPDGFYLYANKKALEIHGYSRDEFLALNLHQVNVPESEALIASRMREVTENGEAAFEVTHFRKDGTTVPLEVYVRTTRWGDRSVILSIGSDITKRKLAENALRESEERYKSLVENASEAIFVAQDGMLRYVNRAGIEMAGYSEEEAVSRPFIEFIHPDDRAMVGEQYLKRLRGEGVDSRVTFRFIAKDGTVKWFELGAALINFEGRPATLNAVTDITERKRAEEEKARLEGQLLQAQKMEAVGRLAGGVAHDFNNMLGVILGHTELALEQVDPPNPLHADLTEIRKAAERSTNLTRQLLAFGRRQAVAPRVLDLNETIAGMLKMLERLIGEDVHLGWQPQQDLWPVKMDPSQIDQILANLCVNARDAIADVGTIRIETRNSTLDEDFSAAHAGSMPGDHVLLAVSDDGCGMDKQTLSHIFEPFFTTKGTGKGTGLGLATVYGIVKQNSGFIDVESEPGRGSTFKIYLPRHAGKADQGLKPVSTSPARRGHETILVVEDEPAILKLTTMLLESQGYTVVAASTPGEAIRLARERAEEIHLLIADVVMPEMNGRELARTMVGIFPRLKCLFMSGYTADVIAHHGVLEEGVSFLQKPFSRKDLAARVLEALEGE